MNKEDLNKMTLRQVQEYTRNLSIREGGLSIFIEKLVSEIERIEILITKNFKNDETEWKDEEI